MKKNIFGKRLCSVEGCNELHHAKGYCSRHLYQMRTRNKIISIGKFVNQCSVEGCDDLYYAKGYCHKHYQKQRRIEQLG